MRYVGVDILEGCHLQEVYRQYEGERYSRFNDVYVPSLLSLSFLLLILWSSPYYAYNEHALRSRFSQVMKHYIQYF